MECRMRVIKYLLLFFNFIFVLGGLTYLILGVLALIGYNYLENLDKDISNLILQESIILIVFSIIFIFIAFLGCCGAIRESYRMMVTFAALLLTMLIVQVIVVIYTSIVNSDKTSKMYTMHFNNYSKGERTTVDFIQEAFECCGIDGPDDFAKLLHISIPETCCDKSTNDICNQKNSYKTGCADALKNSSTLDKSDIAITVIEIGIELIGIILAVCLANSIKNAERTGHVV